MKTLPFLLVGCAGDASTIAEPTTPPHTHHDTDTTAGGPPPPLTIVEYDAQGTACVAGPTGQGFDADEPLTITVDFGCVDGCGVQSFETSCRPSVVAGLLSVTSHGHVVYSADTTTTCTEPCLPLTAQCTYEYGLPAGDTGFVYSSTVTWFTVPTTDIVCAADTDDL